LGFLVKKRLRWGLTVWGWLVLIVLLILPLFLVFRNLYTILSPVDREQTDLLVLEGFVSDLVIRDAITEFKSHPYQLLITTGTPLEVGSMLLPWNNTANVAGASLICMGFDSTKLVIVPTNEIIHDRTYNSARELARWLRNHRPQTRSLNLMTSSVHGARSQVLFQCGIGDSIRVGIISTDNYYYNDNNWWKSSKGFRETMNEAIGYLYVRLFFRSYDDKEKNK
jgi:uncharacterized SAM-binding protein YcdF (DUF218 family)